MSRGPRGLYADERALWSRVASSARAMHPEHPHRAVKSENLAPTKPRPEVQSFRIGEARPPASPFHDLAPSLDERLKHQPIRMERRAHQQLLRGKFQPEARLDLHGMTLAEAHPELIRFILAAHSAGKRLVLVITGKGKRGEDLGPIPQRMGVLRHQVPHWLSQPPLGALILQVVPAHLRHGGSGAFYVYLRRVR